MRLKRVFAGMLCGAMAVGGAVCGNLAPLSAYAGDLDETFDTEIVTIAEMDSSIAVDVTGYAEVEFRFNFGSTYGGGCVGYNSKAANKWTNGSSYANNGETVVVYKADVLDDIKPDENGKKWCGIGCWWIGDPYTCTVIKRKPVITYIDEVTVAEETYSMSTNINSDPENGKVVVDVTGYDIAELTFDYKGTWGGGGIGYNSVSAGGWDDTMAFSNQDSLDKRYVVDVSDITLNEEKKAIVQVTSYWVGDNPYQITVLKKYKGGVKSWSNTDQALSYDVSLTQLLGNTAAVDVESITFMSDTAYTMSYTENGEASSVDGSAGAAVYNMDLIADGAVFTVAFSQGDGNEHYLRWEVKTHDWDGDATYTWADDNSTCTASRKCKNDGCAGVTEQVDTTNEVTKQSSCTEKGNAAYKATFTNTLFAEQTKNVEIALKDHTEVDIPAVDATCTAPGKTAGKKCSVCETVTVEPQDVAPKGVLNEETGLYEHKWKVENGVTGACEICGQEYCDHVGKETEVKNAKEANCTEKGYTGDTYCKNCGTLIEVGKDIDAKGHTEVKDDAVAATCTVDGKTEGSHCSVCEEVIKAQEVVKAEGHKWSEWTVTTAPQVGVKGVETRICSVCKTEETKDVDAVVYESDDIVNSVVTWKEDDDKDLTLTFHRSADDENAIEYYKGITIGGEAVEADAVKGSVKITISKDILSKLEDGEHDAVAEFTDGKIEFKVNVVRKKAADTAGTFPVGALAVLMVGAACAAGLSLKRRKAC